LKEGTKLHEKMHEGKMRGNTIVLYLVDVEDPFLSG
jgi:hypothetical protein